MEMIIDVLADALADCLKMLPFLFTAFFIKLKDWSIIRQNLTRNGTGRCR